MLQTVDQSVRTSLINSTAKPLLLCLVEAQLLLNIHPIVIVAAQGVLLQFGPSAQPLIDFVEVGEVVRIFFIDFVEVCFEGGDVHALIDVGCFEAQVFDWAGLQVLQIFEVFVERHVGLAQQPVALDFAEDEVSDFIVDHPVLLFVDVALIEYLLLDILVDLGEVDDVVVYNREVLILKRVYRLPNAILVCQKVSLLEVYVLPHDRLERS